MNVPTFRRLKPHTPNFFRWMVSTGGALYINSCLLTLLYVYRAPLLGSRQPLVPQLHAAVAAELLVAGQQLGRRVPVEAGQQAALAGGRLVARRQRGQGVAQPLTPGQLHSTVPVPVCSVRAVTISDTAAVAGRGGLAAVSQSSASAGVSPICGASVWLPVGSATRQPVPVSVRLPSPGGADRHHFRAELPFHSALL